MAQVYYPVQGHHYVETVSISADTGADTALPAYLKGRYLTQVHIKTSLDDAVTLTIKKGSSGATIGAITTTAATTGEFMLLTPTAPANGAENRFLTETPYYSLSGLGSGTLTLEIVTVK